MLCCLMLIVFLFSGCGANKTQDKTAPGTENKASRDTIRVAAAADLSMAFKEIGLQFEKETGVPVEFNFGSTGTLALQIENGAPFDLFAAANISFVDGLRDKGRIIPETQQMYAQGRVGIATLKKSSLEVKDLKTLTESPQIKRVAIANPDHAPYGTAAKEAFQHAGLWDQAKDKMVYGKNIQDTLSLLQSGNVDAAIIALSIARPEEVNFSLIDDSWHLPLNQAMAVVKGTKQEASARMFAAYVNSQNGRSIMKKYGFVLPGEK